MTPGIYEPVDPATVSVAYLKRRTGRTALYRILAMTAGIATLTAAGPAACPGTAQAASSAQYQAAYATAIASDGGASIALPDGTDLWTTGDVTAVDGTCVTGAWGYPHGAFMETPSGSATFTVLPGNYGSDYWGCDNPTPGRQFQQVPDWVNSDGSQDFFWAAFPIVDGGTLNVIGERVHATGPGPLDFSIVGSYDARFSISGDAVAYEGTCPVPAASGDVWSGEASDGSGGWWMTSQQGEVAHVPGGGLATSSAWKVTAGAAPSSAGSWPVRVSGHYDLFAAQFGTTTVQRWTASTPAGPWSGPVSAGTLPQPQTDGGIVAHPELGAPPGEVKISWDDGTSAGYDAQFGYAGTA